MNKIKIKQIRSAIGQNEKQRKTLKGLGLGKINRVSVVADNKPVRGMITKVQHLVEIEMLVGEG